MASKATLPYSYVRDELLARRGLDPAVTMTARDLADAARFITAAYRLVFNAHPWPFRLLNEEVACADGLVAWEAIQHSQVYEFYTSSPNQNSSTAEPIIIRNRDISGVWLRTDLATVVAQFVPQTVIFYSPRGIPTMPPQGTTVYAGENYLHDGVYYQVAATSTAAVLPGIVPANPDWVVIPEFLLPDLEPQLWFPLVDATIQYALADWMSSRVAERDQGKDCREIADTMLAKLAEQLIPK